MLPRNTRLSCLSSDVVYPADTDVGAVIENNAQQHVQSRIHLIWQIDSRSVFTCKWSRYFHSPTLHPVGWVSVSLAHRPRWWRQQTAASDQQNTSLGLVANYAGGAGAEWSWSSQDADSWVYGWQRCQREDNGIRLTGCWVGTAGSADGDYYYHKDSDQLSCFGKSRGSVDDLEKETWANELNTGLFEARRGVVMTDHCCSDRLHFWVINVCLIYTWSLSSRNMGYLPVDL